MSSEKRRNRHPKAEQNHTFQIEVDGKKIVARAGQTIAEAILDNGLKVFRRTRNGAPRSFYCGMGVCYECRMIVNGAPNVRTCMTPATPGCKVVSQDESLMKVEW
ncbi:MAG: (2Fe-2S)-binding protein [Deltaproteobacteria bacterium]|nr:(2Fe-2S)-binding protein [Deltaproteobacteria bacterium]MBW1929836.1 (2Fe-2S)-binding protein [Deltaproteobacteria bacterium]MBW2024119.1 (2Fe-2S)-binding protein [Deltaproteobacteria bacterium]MBW2124378.1 (2Fe-2S)-binding protein [Deltaproteobacteria bacterium]RLB24415.1 MAG: (2Fe-2S)-binding protein [Deltaproteobacteria bacterium]